MIALAIPAFGMHTINPGVAGPAAQHPIMQTYDRIQEKFPGGLAAGPVVVQADDVTRRRPGRHRELQKTAGETEGFGQPIRSRPTRAKTSRSSTSRWPATAPTRSRRPRSRRCATTWSRRRSAPCRAPRST